LEAAVVGVIGAASIAAPIVLAKTLDASGNFYRNDDGTFEVYTDSNAVANWNRLKATSAAAEVEGGSKLIWLPADVVFDNPSDNVSLNLRMGNVIKCYKWRSSSGFFNKY